MDTQSIISNKIATMLQSKEPIVKITYVAIETRIDSDIEDFIDPRRMILTSSVYSEYYKYKKVDISCPLLNNRDGCCRFKLSVSDFCKKKFYLLKDIEYNRINYEFNDNLNRRRPVCIINVERIC